MQHITAEVLCSMRILVFNLSHLIVLGIFNINQVARIPLGHDGSAVCFDMCHLRFAALALQQALMYTMCSVQPAQHLYSLVQTKNRSLLRQREDNVTFMTRCHKTKVTNGGVESPQSRAYHSL